jgi:hypothetical protein
MARGLTWLSNRLSPPPAPSAPPPPPAGLEPAHPIGHFYSPFPSLADIQAREAAHFGRDEPLLALDLNDAGQVALFQSLVPFYAELPWTEKPTGRLRYGFENDMYSYSDAIFLYGMIRRFRPGRIVEVGSGHSSAAMLDTSELFLDGAVDCTFIDPYPGTLLALLKPQDRARARLLEAKVQDVPLSTFDALQAGDILFVDSSHVSKVGSDVNHIVFNVLPRLAAGVLVHFHDIYFPFEYPRFVHYQGISWNEAYLLRAFLQFNGAFEIALCNTYLETLHADLVYGAMPLCRKNPGGSIWIRRR